MAAIGSLVFCTDCGNLLPDSRGELNKVMICDCCGARNIESSKAASRTIVTRTKPADFPSPLRTKLSSVQTVERHKIQTEKVDVNASCDKCNRQGVKYSELQLRSADEGTTIIYNCDCGHRWTMNN